MPLHDYKCEQCGEVVEELFHSLNSIPDEIQCTVCEGTMRKQIGRANFKVWHYEPWRMDAESDRRKAMQNSDLRETT